MRILHFPSAATVLPESLDRRLPYECNGTLLVTSTICFEKLHNGIERKRVVACLLTYSQSHKYNPEIPLHSLQLSLIPNYLNHQSQVHHSAPSPDQTSLAPHPLLLNHPSTAYSSLVTNPVSLTTPSLIQIARAPIMFAITTSVKRRSPIMTIWEGCVMSLAGWSCGGMSL